MSVRVLRPGEAVAETYRDAVTFSVRDGALELYDRDVTGLTRIAWAFAPGEWTRVWLEGEEAR